MEKQQKSTGIKNESNDSLKINFLDELKLDLQHTKENLQSSINVTKS